MLFRSLEHWSLIIRSYLPVLENQFDAALGRVANQINDLPRIEAQACHRDFHEGQLLLTRVTCGLIDFDTWCAADPALDTGNFAAHIRLWELRTGGDASAFEQDFLAASSIGMGERFAARAAIWKRAALLRLAAIYAFTSESPKIVTQLMVEAQT